MPRSHFTQAPPHILASIEVASEDGPYAFVLRIFEFGYDLAREDIKTPYTERLEAFKAEGKNTPASLDFAAFQSDRLHDEQLAIDYWKARRHWAETTSIEDDTRAATEAIERAQSAKRQAAIDARAQELLSGQQEKAFAKAQADAAKQLGLS